MKGEGFLPVFLTRQQSLGRQGQCSVENVIGALGASSRRDMVQRGRHLTRNRATLSSKWSRAYSRVSQSKAFRSGWIRSDSSRQAGP